MKKTHRFWPTLLAGVLSVSLALIGPCASAFAAAPGGSETAIAAQGIDSARSADNDGKTGTTVFSAKSEKNYVTSSSFGGTRAFRYTGTEIRPKLIVTGRDNTQFTEGVQYSLSYTNNILCGIGTIHLTALGNYRNPKWPEWDSYFVIYPKKAAISKITVGGTAMAVTVRDDYDSGITGYRVQIRPVGSSEWTTQKLMKGKTRTVFRNLIAGKRYEIRARAYLRIPRDAAGKATVKNFFWGGWSPVKTSDVVRPAKGELFCVGANPGELAISIINQSATGISGYQIFYRPIGTKKWTKETAKPTATWTYRKVQTVGVKGYEAKVRGYVKAEGKTWFGAFSPVCRLWLND